MFQRVTRAWGFGSGCVTCKHGGDCSSGGASVSQVDSTDTGMRCAAVGSPEDVSDGHSAAVRHAGGDHQLGLLGEVPGMPFQPAMACMHTRLE